MRISLAEAAAARAAKVAAPADRPSQRRSSQSTGARAGARCSIEVRSAQTMERNGLQVVRIGGYASVTEEPYEMWDWAGPYNEIVELGAFGPTLARAPQVEFVANHGAGGGLPMAHTRNDTLDLVEDDTGLGYDAYADPTRTDVADLVKALERGDMAEASFKFRIVRGVWSPDYTEYRIKEVDLDRGDVSTVNFGASPLASSGLRTAPDDRAALRGKENDLALARLRLALAG